MYTIGEISEMTGLPISTLRYYDKQGLFPFLGRQSGIRQFSDTELEALRVIECLKLSGLELKDIKRFMAWCAEGPSTYKDRLELMEEQREAAEAELERMSQVLDMIRFKCWYYTKALEEGSEDGVTAMLPDKLPEDIQRLYDHGHGKKSQA